MRLSLFSLEVRSEDSGNAFRGRIVSLEVEIVMVIEVMRGI